MSAHPSSGKLPFTVGVSGAPRVLVCIEGAGELGHGGVNCAVGKGDVLLLPAMAGACLCRPDDDITLLEISLPEKI
jgi:mannose-6-phosphate isomerase